MDYYERMTNKQRAFLDVAKVEEKKDYIYCEQKMKELEDSTVSLPAKNEEGLAVVHGCNMIMYRLKEHYKARFYAARDIVGYKEDW